MKTRLGAVIVLATVVACAFAVAGEPVSPNPPPPNKVMIDGCVVPGVEFHCLIVQSGQHTYDVTGLGPKVGDHLRGIATTASRYGICMQGATVVAFEPSKEPVTACDAEDPRSRFRGNPTPQRPQ